MQRAGRFILDVGAGSGRDAAWFAASGCDVVAVEPASRMLERAKELHRDAQIRWVQDKLPGLENVFRLSLSFDFILVSAVWMHIPPEDRQRAFRKLVSLLKPGGRMVISLRHGPLDEKREAHPVSVTELERLAREYAIAITRVCQSPDRMQRTCHGKPYVFSSQTTEPKRCRSFAK
jgi:SAM-dependent methyltransferase